LRSTISCAKRLRARSISVAVMICAFSRMGILIGLERRVTWKSSKTRQILAHESRKSRQRLGFGRSSRWEEGALVHTSQRHKPSRNPRLCAHASWHPKLWRADISSYQVPLIRVLTWTATFCLDAPTQMWNRRRGDNLLINNLFSINYPTSRDAGFGSKYFQSGELHGWNS